MKRAVLIALMVALAVALWRSWPAIAAWGAASLLRLGQSTSLLAAMGIALGMLVVCGGGMVLFYDQLVRLWDERVKSDRR